jgi:hypothetical protein
MAQKLSSGAWENKINYIEGYNKEHYERMYLTIPKGMKQHYKAEAEKRGLSVSKLFTTAADEYIEKH